MIKLTAPTDKGCIEINGSLYPKGTLFAPIKGEQMEIRMCGYGDLLVQPQLYSEYVKENDTPFTSISELKTFIIDNFFINPTV